MTIAPEPAMNQGSSLSPIISSPQVSASTAMIQTTMLCENAAETPSRTACNGVPRTATMNAAIMVLE